MRKIKKQVDDRKIRPERFTWEEGDFMVIRYDEDARKEVNLALEEQQRSQNRVPSSVR